VCALAHWLEGSGVPTVTIGLVPQHVERMRPPRALLVPFELGRPLGVPDDPAFQHRVLDAALALVPQQQVPVVEWFDEPAPAAADADTGWACPVTFAAEGEGQPDDDVAAVIAEVELLRPWHDRAVAGRGGSAVGASGFDIEAAVRYLGASLDGTPPAPPEGLSPADAFKLAAEDLKLYYQQAATAQPGGSSRDIADWFWDETRAGTLVRRLAVQLAEAEDPALRAFASFTLVPEGRR